MTAVSKRANPRGAWALAAIGVLQGGSEPTLLVPVLDNGDFHEGPTSPDESPPLLPWWEIEGGRFEVAGSNGERSLALDKGATAKQPMAAYAPTVSGLLVRGRVRGPGRLAFADAQGGRAEFEVEGPFEITGKEIAARRGREPVPRFARELGHREGGRAEWGSVEVLAPLPSPSADDLRAEISAAISWIVETWRAKASDDQGRKTAFVARQFDALTGDPLAPIPGGLFPLHVALADALVAREELAWRAVFDGFLADYFELGFHGTTGLPRRWDCAADAPLDSSYVQIGMDLGFLIDLAERGAEPWRTKARAAATKIGETVLEHGVLPDGRVAAEYRPSDAAVSTNVPPLRRLDVAAPLARLGALLGDERYLRAARGAVLELEFTHAWPGSWSEIDPGFDDDFGLYGARAVTMLRARPQEREFRELVLSGWRRYEPLWRDSTRFGGSVAADQVRCWALLADFAELEPAVRVGVSARIDAAVRAHWKGEQYPGGAWGDISFFGFDPKTGILVGDLPGAPANLLHGIAIAHGVAAEPRRAELRAMYAAVLRSTFAAYRRPYGCLTTQRERQGANPAGGELRLLPGLVRMLKQLSGG